jgi:hypothetical protein
MSGWKDVSMYSSGETDRSVKSVSLKLGRYILSVTRRHPDTEHWFFSFGSEGYKQLKSVVFEEAKKEALQRVEAILNEAIRDVVRERGFNDIKIF